MKEFLIFVGVMMGLITMVVTPIVVSYFKQAEKLKEKRKLLKEELREKSRLYDFARKTEIVADTLKDEEISARLKELNSDTDGDGDDTTIPQADKKIIELEKEILEKEQTRRNHKAKLAKQAELEKAIEADRKKDRELRLSRIIESRENLLDGMKNTQSQIQNWGRMVDNNFVELPKHINSYIKDNALNAISILDKKLNHINDKMGSMSQNEFEIFEKEFEKMDREFEMIEKGTLLNQSYVEKTLPGNSSASSSSSESSEDSFE